MAVGASRMREKGHHGLLRIYIHGGKKASNLGLNEAYCIGPSYYAAYIKTYNSKAEDFDSHYFDSQYFDDELLPILKEYVRGRKNVDSFIKKCKEAFVGKKEKTAEGNKTEEVTDNEG